MANFSRFEPGYYEKSGALSRVQVVLTEDWQDFNQIQKLSKCGREATRICLQYLMAAGIVTRRAAKASSRYVQYRLRP